MVSDPVYQMTEGGIHSAQKHFVKVINLSNIAVKTKLFQILSTLQFQA